MKFCAAVREKMHSENWDDLRYILAVANFGSVLQAAKKLGVNHATVLRHVAAFEERHNATLFDRTPQGYRLRPGSTAIIQAARAAETAMQEVARLSDGVRRPRSETIRITSTDTLCSFILPQFVAMMDDDDDDHHFVLLSSNTHIDLMREQAHIVVRPATKLTDDLVGNIAGSLSFGAYAANSAIDKWLGLSGPLARSIAGQWMAKNISANKLSAASDSFLTLAAMAQRGRGIAILPRFVGEVTPGLQRLTDTIMLPDVPIWVARHIDAIETAQIEDVRSKLTDFLEGTMMAGSS